MEKKIIFILSFWFFVSCSETKKEDSLKKNEAEVKAVDKKISNVYCGNLEINATEKELYAIEVEWMYIDDSLKYLCRPLNFILPKMESDIRTLPLKPTLEVSRFQVFKEFILHGEREGELNDTTYYFAKTIILGNCHCHLIRYYYGKSEDKNFDGYTITEQVICNAKSNEIGFGSKPFYNPDVKEEEKKQDSTKYEMHGHEH